MTTIARATPTARTRATLLALALATACAPPRAGAPAPGAASAGSGALPAIPARSGTLAPDLVYPGEGQALAVRDSTFLFGSVGTGGATLTVNGARVEVAPNGAFLAYLPVPADGVYRLDAAAGGRTAALTRRVRVPAPAAAPAAAGRPGIVPGSPAPRGAVLATEGERLDVSVRGTPGASARVVLPGGAAVPLVERAAVERSEGFMLDRSAPAGGVSEYVGTLVATGPLAADGTAGGARVELVRGADTVRAPLGLSLRVLRAGESRVAVARSRAAGGTVIGTAVPGPGTPYNWFFPNGTRLEVTGARGGQYRVRLGPELSVWVDSAEVALLPAGTPAPRGAIGTVRAIRHPDWTDVRVATSERLPFEVEADDSALTLTVYGASTRTNWLRYGATDDVIRSMEWSQPAEGVYRLHVRLAEPLWGWLPYWDGAGNLVLRVRRPPRIDPTDPLRGLHVAVDAGHPPGGAIGPTRLTEAEANLAIARRLAALLRARGARVLETRPDTAAVALGARPQIATDSSVHLLVSVHNNAFPDGVNPFENNGTSVFYNHAPSLELAREVQRELLRELGLRDLGIARADLALVRPTWMPAILSETMFLMVPQQEAALRDPAVQERIARAHLRGIERYLRARAVRR